MPKESRYLRALRMINVRKIIFIPILHTEADYGSISKEMTSRFKKVLGEKMWEKRQKTILSLWERISDYFDDKNVSLLRIYQDGMAADGVLGKKIVWKVAEVGSANHKLIRKLIERGAILEKTEDPELLKEERDLILKMIKPKSPYARLINRSRYIHVKDRLLNKRDEFIANQINRTLKEGETGVLFLGASHDVLSKLSADIVVEEFLKRKEVLALNRVTG